MKYKSLGRTGIKVSELCFGTMSFGGRADKSESEKMYKTCREAGSTSLTVPMSTRRELRRAISEILFRKNVTRLSLQPRHMVLWVTMSMRRA